MIKLILEPNLSESSFAKNILLDGVVALSETPSTTAEIFWRWDDETSMKPESLGRVTAGNSLRIPFDLKGRDIRLYLVSETADGLRSVSGIEQAVQTVFAAPARDYSGEINVEAGENLDPFDLVHIYDSGTEKAEKADASDPTKPARAFVIEAAAGDSLVTGDQVRLFFGGNLITKTGAGWTPGDVLYLDTAGGITNVAPSTSGYIVQVIGTAITDEIAIFEPDEPEIIP